MHMFIEKWFFNKQFCLKYLKEICEHANIFWVNGFQILNLMSWSKTRHLEEILIKGSWSKMKIKMKRMLHTQFFYFFWVNLSNGQTLINI